MISLFNFKHLGPELIISIWSSGHTLIFDYDFYLQNNFKPPVILSDKELDEKYYNKIIGNVVRVSLDIKK